MTLLRARVVSRGVAVHPKPKFGLGKTHKASSAEAMLRHCLRQRGWTRLYGEDGLTGQQHLSLLDDVRQYGRMYLRHEAESFFDRYGVNVDDNEARRSLQFQGEEQESAPGIEANESGTASQQAGRSWGISSQGQVQDLARGIASRAAGALSRFFDRTKTFLKELVVAGAMALKGEEPLTNAEIYALDRLTKKQHEYLDNFQREVTRNPPREIAEPNSVIIVEPAPMTPGQFVARLEQYGNAPWEVQNVGREVVKNQGVFSAERRVHKLSMEQHRPCTGPMGCLDQSRLGWQPVGSLIEIGDCYCMLNCDCYFEWQDPKGKIYVSPWGRHNPYGHNQPGGPDTKLPGIAFPTDAPIKELPSGPGPAEKRRPKKIKLKPPQKVGEPYPKGGTYPPARPLPSVQELLDEAGSPYAASEYEEA